MASDQAFVDFVVAQIGNAGDITAKKMFGEYGLPMEKFSPSFVITNCLSNPPMREGPLSKTWWKLLPIQARSLACSLKRKWKTGNGSATW